MSEFAKTLNDLARLCGKSEYQLAQLSGLAPTFVRRLLDGEKNALNLTIIHVAIALVMDRHLPDWRLRRDELKGAPLAHEERA